MPPNPFTDYIKLKVSAPEKTTITLTIFDATGKTVKTQRHELSPGVNYIIVGGLGFLTGGVYTLKTEGGLGTMESQFIK